jgi:hypothetical protein
MARKTSLKRSSRASSRQNSWKQVLSLIALIPMFVGALLILTALTGFVVWTSAPEQALMGGFYILFSFVVLNTLQKQWTLVIGWLLVSASVWVLTSRGEFGFGIGGVGLAAVGVALICRQFLRQRREYLDRQPH